MAINKRIKFIRGNEAANDAFIGYEGEFTVDTTNWTIRLHDGVTPGGHVVGGSFDYADLSNAPVLFSGSYNDLTEVPASLATESYVDGAINALVNSAPETLDTINELAAALGNDANFASAITTTLAQKSNSSDLSALAFSGNYTDLLGAPSIPGDVADLTDAGGLLFSGDYNDLLNKPLFDGSFATLSGVPTTLAGYGIADAQPLNHALSDISNADLYAGKLFFVANGVGDVEARTPIQARADLELHPVADSGDYTDLINTPTIPTVPTVVSAFTNDAGYLTSNVSAPIKVEGVAEKFSSKVVSGPGVWTFDCTNGTIFTVSGMTANFTPNLINLAVDAGYATTVTLIINQGAVAYMPTNLSIDGLGKTINWQGQTIPTGTPNGKDIVSFSILNDAGSYTIFGQSVDF